MTKYQVISKTLRAGLWTVRLGASDGAKRPPAVSAQHLNVPLPGVEVLACEGGHEWQIQVPIRTSMLTDGVHTIILIDSETGESLDHLDLICGDELNEDLRSEVALLRAELDMLKRAFRRHCLETK